MDVWITCKDFRDQKEWLERPGRNEINGDENVYTH